MHNPYKPPEAPVHATSVTWAEMGYTPKRPMIIAVSILSVIALAGTAEEYFVDHKYDVITWIVLCVVGVLTCLYTVFLLNRMANGPGADGAINAFTWWGFFWRGLAAQTLSFFLLVFINYIVFGIGGAAPFGQIIILNVIGICLQPLIIWALFSNNRRLQYQWLFSYLSRV